MSLSRRDFLKLGSLTAVTTTATACSLIGREVAQRELTDVDTAVTLSTTNDPIRRLLNRAGYGPRPGDVERIVAMGFAAYLEEQLNPAAIEDTAVDILLRRLTAYHMDVSQLIEQDPRDTVPELIGATISRALHSNRQLYEVMVEFWSDHFNIYLRKNEFTTLLKIIDDRDVIRPHALGKFRDLLFASAQSPAMLIYLDNVQNEKSHPNENYAREVMELHTMGVHSGYTQTDIQELARALTGWSVARRGLHKGEFLFQPEQHDEGEKLILGQMLPAGQGQADVAQALAILVTHPATAVFIATKLVRRFVADEPPPALVEQVAQTFTDTDGDIKNMLRVIFLSEEFATAPPKLKRPYTYFISALRALHTDVGGQRDLYRWLELLGQPLFQWPAPNGYPDASSAWASNLLPRWNFALALAHGRLQRTTAPLEQLIEASNATSSGEVVQLFANLVWGRPLDDPTYQLLQDYIGSQELNRQTEPRLRDAVALLLASPAFQWT
jgi:uncharacterized protein (DUF1800 family)